MRCNHCKKNRLIKFFSKNQQKCKTCQSKFGKLHYSNNKYQYIKARRKNHPLYRIRNISYFQKLRKELGCAFCNEHEPCVLDFHHLDPNLKKRRVSTMIANYYKLNTILEEVMKCIILCANCHRKVHSSLLILTSDHVNVYTKRRDETIEKLNLEFKNE